jgi:hypothetical protein
MMNRKKIQRTEVMAIMYFITTPKDYRKDHD